MPQLKFGRGTTFSIGWSHIKREKMLGLLNRVAQMVEKSSATFQGDRSPDYPECFRYTRIVVGLDGKTVYTFTFHICDTDPQTYVVHSISCKPQELF